MRRTAPSAAVATGTWSFDWVVPDRVLTGRAVIPDWNQSAGMLFYLNERMYTLEMAQVGADGQLLVMTGAAGTETRTTEEIPLPDGRHMMQRHTRFKVTADRYEAKLETSYDGGQSWKPGHAPALRAHAGEPAGLSDGDAAPHPAAALRTAHVARRHRRA
jgi:hypothetical protein